MQGDLTQLAVAVCAWSATSAAGTARVEQLLLPCASWSRLLDKLVPKNQCHFTQLFRDWWGMDGDGGQAESK